MRNIYFGEGDARVFSKETTKPKPDIKRAGRPTCSMVKASSTSALSFLMLLFSVASKQLHAFVIGSSAKPGRYCHFVSRNSSLSQTRRVVNRMMTTTNTPTTATSISESSMIKKKPIAVLVEAEIVPDRLTEFLDLIEANAIATRLEPGCIRFDVLQQDNELSSPPRHVFYFYEVYQDTSAVDYHKQQPHYNRWAEFKGSGGTVRSESTKLHGEFLT
jgi:(4S)-4-hydroxy-5-phosphonooxypentane-2,3-dione isomerase